MLLLIERGNNRAVRSLFSDAEVAVPDWQQTTYTIEVALVDRIVNPTDSRLFDPVDTSGYSVKVGVGTGYALPLAGVWMAGYGTVTSGTVTNAKRYRIVDFQSGDDFTNLGFASNATGEVATVSGTTPTTWTNGSSLVEITADLDFDNSAAELQTALNALASITAAGGVTVGGESGLFTVTFAIAGSREEISGFSENLAPDSTVDPGTVINGTSLLREIQTIRVTQDPIGLVTLDDTIDAATATSTEVATGGSGVNHQQRISFSPAPYGGSFTIEVGGMVTSLISHSAAASAIVSAIESLRQSSGTIETGQKYKIGTFVSGDDFTNIGAASNATGVVFTATGTTPTTWTNGSVLTSVGTGNVECVKESPTSWLLSFIGDMAETDMISVAVDDSSLLSIQGRSGTLDTRTAAAELLLGNGTTAAVTLEVECTPSGGTPTREYRRAGTLIGPVIPPASESTVPMGGMYDTVTGLGPYRITIDNGVIGYSNF